MMATAVFPSCSGFLQVVPPPAGATLDPTIKNAAIVLSNGNMTATLTNGGVQDVVGIATFAITSGKKSWIEFLVGATSDRVAFGIGTASTLTSDTAFLGCTSGNDIGNYSSGAGVWQNGSNLAGSGGFSAGDRVNIAVDTTASSITWYVNNVSQVSVTYSLTGDVFAAYGLRYDSVTPAQISLVAPASFVNAPPSGFTKYGL
jgi:hypothetical protein